MENKEFTIESIKEYIKSLFLYKREVVKCTQIIGICDEAKGISVAHVDVSNTSKILVNYCIYVHTKNNDDKREALTRIVAENELEGLPCIYILGQDQYSLQLMEKRETDKTNNFDFKKEIEHYIDMPVDSVSVDTFDLPFKRIRDNKPMMYTVITQDVQILQAEGLIDDIGLSMKYIDIQELALRNLKYMLPKNESSTLLAWIYNNEAKLIVLHDGNICALRRFDLDLSSIKSSSENVTSQADPILLASESQDSNKTETVIEKHTNNAPLERLEIELERTEDYCLNEFAEYPAKSIITVPPTDNMSNIFNHLKSRMQNSNLIKFAFPDNVVFKQDVPSDMAAKCFLAILGCLRILEED